MSSSYRAHYHLRAHKRDYFIEFIKSLLLTPFILHSYPSIAESSTVVVDTDQSYGQVLKCVEELIDNHIQNTLHSQPSRLSQLCPSIGHFFTPLPLYSAFMKNDKKRSISGRKQVSPSFNDIRYLT